jgi:hypothetical protein
MYVPLRESLKFAIPYLRNTNRIFQTHYLPQSHVTVKEANLYCELEAGNYSSVNALMDWTTIPKSKESIKFGWNTRHLLNEMKQNLLEKFVVNQTNESDYEE